MRHPAKLQSLKIYAKTYEEFNGVAVTFQRNVNVLISNLNS